jgi:hypothetical protein
LPARLASDRPGRRERPLSYCRRERETEGEMRAPRVKRNRQ